METVAGIHIGDDHLSRTEQHGIDFEKVIAAVFEYLGKRFAVVI